MNIIRGMDRIALVLAIIAILPAFVLGGEIINRTFKSVTPDYEAKYKAWEKKFGKEWKEWESSGSIRMQGLGPPEPPGIEYNYPPDWQCILGGLLSAFLSFVVVLYSFRGMTRGTRWFALWIIEGFKDERKGEPDKHMGNEANNQDCVSNGT